MSTTMPPGSASADDHVQTDYGGYWQGGAAQPSMPPTGAPQPLGYPYMGAPAVAPVNVVKNYMVQAVLCTLFLCLPTGIAAIYFAAKVNPASQAGDVAGALEASKKAKMFCWISVAVGAVLWLIMILGVMSAASNSAGYTGY